ncbi:MAG: MlaC/ttg2D family ABC transporter substrate-binding protein [Spongiibacteraceae bacterium]
MFIVAKKRVFMFLQVPLLLSLVFSWGAVAHADANAVGPYEVVASTTQALVKTIESSRDYAAAEPQRFNSEVLGIMDDVVDFQSFARGVMGEYGSRRYYVSLANDEERKLFRERVLRFTQSFKEGLINTYAKGLLGFNGHRIEVLPLAEDADLSASVVVYQNVYGERPAPYEIIYTLRKSGDGKWRLRNVVIEGLNLGRIYQNQFTAAVKQYNGDLDRVIENWSVTPQEVTAKQATIK